MFNNGSDFFSNPDPGSELSPSRIPDPHQKFKYPHPDPHQKKIRTRIRITRFVLRILNIFQDLKILLKNIKFQLWLNRIRILSIVKSEQVRDPDPNNKVISRIRIHINKMRILIKVLEIIFHHRKIAENFEKSPKLGHFTVIFIDITVAWTALESRSTSM